MTLANAADVAAVIATAVRAAAAWRDRVVTLAFERGLLVLGAGDNTLRLCPPLVITRDQCDFALDTLEACLQQVIAEA